MVCVWYLTFQYFNVDADQMNHFAADVLNVNSPMALITPDMLNMDLIQEARENTKAKIIKGHPLAPSLAPPFRPSYHAYGRLHTSILQCFAVLHNQPRQSLLDNIPNDVSSVHAVHTHGIIDRPKAYVPTL